MKQIKIDNSFSSKTGLSSESREKIKKNLKTLPFIKEKIAKLNISVEEFDYYLGYFVSYAEDYKLCQKCKNLQSCSKEIKGIRMDLERDEFNQINRVFDLCHFQKEERRINLNYLIRDFPSSLLKMELEDLDDKEGREDLEYELLSMDLNKKINKGIFVHGKPNVGKSYPFIAFCNGLVRKDVKCAFVNVKEFIESLKRTFNNIEESFNDLMDKVKEADILVLDDLGEEKASEWVRDDILTTILDYRFKNNFVTFITSSYSLDELEILYAISSAGRSAANMKSKNFIEKIKSTCPTIIEVK